MEAWLPFQSALQGSPLWPGPWQPLPRIVWHFLLRLLPSPRPSSSRQQGLGPGQWVSPGPPRLFMSLTVGQAAAWANSV